MKHLYYTVLLTVLMSMVGANAFAHDFAVANDDGVTIYYVMTSDTEVAVSYDDSYSNEYSGNVVIPEYVYYDGTTYYVTGIGASAFCCCDNLTNITIPNSVTEIGIYAFDRCTGLTNITIPNSVTSIRECAFSGCSGLTSITIPNSVKSIDSIVFYQCTSLKSIVVEQGNPNYDSRDNCNAIIETKSNTLTHGCKTTTIPNSVTSIGSYAFYGCYGLTSITIPNSVTSIGECAFFECSGLTSITIPNGVTSIGSEAFNRCSGLTSITIPNSVTSIGGSAFYYCSGLTSITIPNSVTSIGSGVFSYCTGLTSIIVEKEEPITLSGSLVDNPSKVILYIPIGCVEKYQNANYWKNFTNIREFVPSSVSITMATASGKERSMIGYSSKYGLDFTGTNDVKAYAAVAYTDDHITYLSRIYVVPPYTGVVLRTETPGITIDIPTTNEDVILANLLLPAVSNTTINPTETIDGVEYRNLMVGQLSGTTTMGFVEFSSAVTRSNNCYLRVPLSFYNSAASARELGGLNVVFDDDETTDIRTINEPASPASDKVYDLQGRPVTTTKKGLVIKNGKLIFVKP